MRSAYPGAAAVRLVLPDGRVLLLSAVPAALGVVVAGVWFVRSLRARRQSGSGLRGDDLLTVLAAAAATGVAGTGMWRFAGSVLHLSGPLRGLLFGFLELAVITCAVRARREVAVSGHAGVDGAAVWLLTALSGLLSALDARSFPEAVARLSAPLVAAFLWERGLAPHRHRVDGQTRWNLTLDRALVFFGLAEATGRSPGDAEAHRRLYRLARAVVELRAARVALPGRRAAARVRRAERRLNRAMRAAVRHARLGFDPARVEELLAHLAVLSHATALVDLELPSPWAVGRLRETGREPSFGTARSTASPARALRRTAAPAMDDSSRGKRARGRLILQRALQQAADQSVDGDALLQQLRQAGAETSQIVRLAFLVTRDPGEDREKAARQWPARARAWLQAQQVPHHRRELSRIRDEQMLACYPTR